jgi:methylenetetrahydrofolate reductase (NADPH)
LKVSFEVYPPRDPADEGSLRDAILRLAELSPEFISVTFGAGGSSTKNSLDVLKFIRDNTSATPLAHLTCVGNTAPEARDLIRQFLGEGISNFLALRGDLPAGQTSVSPDSLQRADQLVALIREHSESRDVAVAAFPNGHPESGSERTDIDALVAKQSAGADYAISQLFFFSEDFLEFKELARTRGVELPLIPGIMPIVSHARLRRVLELTGETEPSGFTKALAEADDADRRREVGISWSANQIRDLAEAGVEHVHLYAFNEYKNVTEVLLRAGVR